jgi:hypothetical protein
MLLLKGPSRPLQAYDLATEIFVAKRYCYGCNLLRSLNNRCRVLTIWFLLKKPGGLLE